MRFIRGSFRKPDLAVKTLFAVYPSAQVPKSHHQTSFQDKPLESHIHNIRVVCGLSKLSHRINHPLGYFHPVNAYQSRLENISALRTFNTRSCSVLFSLCAIPDKYCNIQYELCHSPSTEDLVDY